MKTQHTPNYPRTRTHSNTYKKKRDKSTLSKLTLTLTNLKMKSTTLKKMYTHSKIQSTQNENTLHSTQK